MDSPVISRFQQLRRKVFGWLRPPRQLKTTTLGKLGIVFAIVIGVAATNTGNNLLYLVLGGLFGIIAASGVLSERILKGLQVEVTLPAVAVVGRPAAVGIALRAAQRVDSFLLDVQLVGAQRKALGQTHLRELLRGSSRTATARVVPEIRGAFTISGIRVATRFPFQMYEKSRFFTLPMVIWAAPAPEPASTENQRALEGDARTKTLHRRDGSQFRGLRERETSDPISRIHWKRAAATGEHVVKVFSAEAAPQIEIRLFQGVSEFEFEKGLRRAAGIVDLARYRERAVKLTAGQLTALMHADGGGWIDVQLLLAKLQRADVPVAPEVLDTRLVA